MSCYAIKSIDNKILDLIVMTWEECASIVTGHKAVFKSFDDENEANKFLKTAPITVQEFTKTLPTSPTEKLVRKYPNKVRASFTYPIYNTSDNSYCAYQYCVVEDDSRLSDRFICVGAYLPNFKDVIYDFEGEWKNGKRGYQFHVTDYTEVVETKEQIVKYLASGLFKGVSIKTAIKLYETFGDDVFEYIENDPMELTKIPRISKKKAFEIMETYESQKQAREIIQYLTGFGVSHRKATEVYRRFGINSLTIAKTNPYRLCEIDGITFDTADRIGIKENLPADSQERMDCCAKYILKKAEVEGHLGIDKEVFGKAMLSKLNSPLITPRKVLDYTIQAIYDKKLKYETTKKNDVSINYIMLPYVYNMEKSIASNIRRIYEEENKCNKEVTIDRIKTIADRIGIVLDDNQINAIYLSLTNNISIITGGAGTGKTTIIQIIAEYIKEYTELSSVFLAPTGRASRRITESTGYDARTIHSFLKLYDKNQSAEFMELQENVFICIDEFSMTDVYVMHYLMESIGNGCKIVFVGDKNQLPSVGAGAILRDMIESETLPVSYLEKIYRQNGQSKICTNAEKIKTGNINLEYDDSFKIFDIKGLDNIQNVLIDETMDKINKYGIDNVACLSPYKDYEAGVIIMNTLLQAKLNPPDEKKKERKYGSVTFREGDRVMNLQNNDTVSNGDIGFIKHIGKNEDDEECIFVDFYGNLMEYTSDNIDSLTLAYCFTYHKSQGSEYDAVVLCLSSFHRPMLKRNVFYTGVTRAKKEITVIGESSAFETAILNEEDCARNTLLWYHLKKEFGSWTYL